MRPGHPPVVLEVSALDEPHDVEMENNPEWNATTTLNYDPAMQMIVFDHVAPPTDKAKGATFTYVPDGTYEGFVWKSNRWNWVEKVFTFAINEDDNPPIPVPLFGKPDKQPELPH